MFLINPLDSIMGKTFSVCLTGTSITTGHRIGTHLASAGAVLTNQSVGLD